MEKDQLFLESLVKAIVKNPDDVRIERTVDEMGVYLRLWVNKEDMGLIIGRKGTNADAIKHLVKLFGLNNQSRIAVKIEEPEE